MKKLFIFFVAFFFLSGCVTPYEAPFLNDDFKDLLVVEGTITDGETIIKLSRSYPIYPDPNASGEEYYGSQPVYGASVWVEGENGERFDAEERTTGEYIASGVTFSDDVRYRLRMELDGEEYESDYRLPQHTPSIESVDFHLKNGNAGPLQVRFNVNAEEDDSRYYLWRYEENWEIHAAERAFQYFGHPNVPGVRLSYLEFTKSFINDDGVAGYDNIRGVLPMDFPNSGSPYYYCWKNNKSKELLLAATDLLTENALQDQVLYEIELSDDRLSSLYNTKISLYSIGEDAYFYYLNQKRNTDETGSIFSPIPAEMRGNIINTTSPDVPVIGFVDVSVLSLQDIYLEDYDLYQPPFDPYTIYSGAKENVSAQMNQYLANLYEIPIDELDPMIVYQYMSTFYPITVDEVYQVPPGVPYEMGYYTYNVRVTTERCIDCRLSGGNKNRPSWWPNDHY